MCNLNDYVVYAINKRKLHEMNKDRFKWEKKTQIVNKYIENGNE